MYDPIASLAIIMQARKGTFALLLGSGVSRSSQIPTGWEIVLRLIEQFAAARGESIVGDPAEWYRQTLGREPSYSDLLDNLAPTQAERSQLIRPFMEPSVTEVELGMKQPTAAHRAIARLVVNGYVRVIVTTNFDRLLETALSEVGITSTVISSADGVSGAFPLAHNTCTIIKIHGDYLDSRIRNTPEELGTYPDELIGILEQAFREYGVIISGWSGEWDTALRTVLLNSPSPWFSTYWVANREPGPLALEIVTARSGKVITNMSADKFFSHLSESVTSVEGLTVPELVSTAIAVASLKRYIDDPTKRIRVFDMLVDDSSKVRKLEIDEVPDSYFAEQPTKESILARLDKIESETATLRALMATIGFWGGEEHARALVAALERLGSMPILSASYMEGWAELRYYPALLCLYSVGMGSMASGNYGMLRAAVYDATTQEANRDERIPLVLRAKTSVLLKQFQDIALPKYVEGAFLTARFRETSVFDAVEAFHPNRQIFLQQMDAFEYLYAVSGMDVAQVAGSNMWPSIGRLVISRDGYTRREESEKVRVQLESQEGWPPLRSGMFGGDSARAEYAQQAVDQTLDRIN